jgi:hypothetical protein
LILGSGVILLRSQTHNCADHGTEKCQRSKETMIGEYKGKKTKTKKQEEKIGKRSGKVKFIGCKM